MYAIEGSDLMEQRSGLDWVVGRDRPEDAQRGARIGMTDEDCRRYDLVRAIRAAVNDDWSEAGFEQECSRTTAKANGKDMRANSFHVPADVVEFRDLTVSTPTAGGNTVDSNLLASSFIDLYRNRLILRRAGAQFMPGLVGNVDIPRQTGGATAYWVGEGGSPAESQPVFDQLRLRPHTVGTYTDYSRRLVNQSSINVQQFIRDDLASIIALATETAFLHNDDVGGNTDAPSGLQFESGVATVTTGAPNGGPLTWEKVLELETTVATANADIGSLSYLTNSTVRGAAKGIQKMPSSGKPIWDEGSTPLNGYPARVSNMVRSDITTGSGTTSALFFGNWRDMIIGLWSGLEILVDPYTHSTSGTVRVVALQDVDCGFRHGASFAMMTDITG